MSITSVPMSKTCDKSVLWCTKKVSTSRTFALSWYTSLYNLKYRNHSSATAHSHALLTVDTFSLFLFLFFIYYSCITQLLIHLSVQSKISHLLYSYWRITSRITHALLPADTLSLFLLLLLLMYYSTADAASACVACCIAYLHALFLFFVFSHFYCSCI